MRRLYRLKTIIFRGGGDLQRPEHEIADSGHCVWLSVTKTQCISPDKPGMGRCRLNVDQACFLSDGGLRGLGRSSSRQKNESVGGCGRGEPGGKTGRTRDRKRVQTWRTHQEPTRERRGIPFRCSDFCSFVQSWSRHSSPSLASDIVGSRSPKSLPHSPQQPGSVYEQQEENASAFHPPKPTERTRQPRVTRAGQGCGTIDGQTQTGKRPEQRRREFRA